MLFYLAVGKAFDVARVELARFRLVAARRTNNINLEPLQQAQVLGLTVAVRILDLGRFDNLSVNESPAFAGEVLLTVRLPGKCCSVAVLSHCVRL